MNQPMSRKQLSDLVNPVSHAGDCAGCCPQGEAARLQRSGLFPRALDLDFDAAATDASGDVRLTGIVRAAVGFLCVAARQTIDVLDNSSHYGVFSWCLHDRSISGVDSIVTVR